MLQKSLLIPQKSFRWVRKLATESQFPIALISSHLFCLTTFVWSLYESYMLPISTCKCPWTRKCPQKPLFCLRWWSIFTVQHWLGVLNGDNQETEGETRLSETLKSNHSLLLSSAQGCSESIHIIQISAGELLSDLLWIKLLGFLLSWLVLPM